MKKQTTLLLLLTLLASIYSSLAQDIGVSQIVSPAAGSNLNKGSSTSNPFSFKFKNYGSTAVTAGTPFSLKVQFNNTGNIISKSLSPVNDWAAGSEMNYGVGIIIQSVSPGPITVCAWLEITSDTDPSNDKSCEDYILVESSTGISEEDSQMYTAYYYGGKLNITLNKNLNVAHLNISTMNGQIIKSEQITTVQTIDISAFPKGVYVLNVYSEEKGLAEMKKIVVD